MANILVIDDDNLVCGAMHFLLRGQGHTVTVAHDGKSGIDAFNGAVFDLAIVDLFMPGMNGLKVIEAIREINSSTPVIAASGFLFGKDCPPMPGFEAMATESGAALTLYKPFRPDDVLRAVDQAIGTAA